LASGGGRLDFSLTDEKEQPGAWPQEEEDWSFSLTDEEEQSEAWSQEEEDWSFSLADEEEKPEAGPEVLLPLTGSKRRASRSSRAGWRKPVKVVVRSPLRSRARRCRSPQPRLSLPPQWPSSKLLQPRLSLPPQWLSSRLLQPRLASPIWGTHVSRAPPLRASGRGREEESREV